MKGRIRIIHSKQVASTAADYYQFLEIPRSASSAEIGEALSRKQSDLRSADSRDLRELKKQVASAGRTLSDPERRRHYDMRLSKQQEPALSVQFPSADSSASKRVVPAGNGEEPTVAGAAGAARRKIEPIRVMGINDHTRIVEGWQFAASRRVVVKQLSRNHRKEPFESDFADEATFLAGVNCPTIVEVYSVDTASGFYVMEYVHQSLTDLIGGKAISEESIAKWLRQALAALDTVHQSGQFIGRLGAKSFLVTESGDLKLKDAPASDRAGTLVRPREGQKCAAPELLSPDTFGEPGPHSDIYALGFLMLELLTGRKFRSWFKSIGKNADSTTWMSWHGSAAEELPPIKTLLPKLSQDLAGILERMVAKRVVERYESAKEVLAKLSELDLRVLAPMEEGHIESISSSESNADPNDFEMIADNPPNIFADADSEDSAPEAWEFLTHPGAFIKLAGRIRRTFRGRLSLLIAPAVFVLGLALVGMSANNGVEASTDFPDDKPSAQAEIDGTESVEIAAAEELAARSPIGMDPAANTSESTADPAADAVESWDRKEPNAGRANTSFKSSTIVATNAAEPPGYKPRKRERRQAPLTKAPETEPPPIGTQNNDHRNPARNETEFSVIGGEPGGDKRLKNLLRLAIEADLDGNILKKKKVIGRIEEFERRHPREPRASFAIACLTRGSDQSNRLRTAAALSVAAQQTFLEPDRMAVELAIAAKRPSRQILGRLQLIKRDHSLDASTNSKFYEWAGRVVEYLNSAGSAEDRMTTERHADLLPAGATTREFFSRGRRRMAAQMRRIVRDRLPIEPAIFFPVDYALKLEAALRTIP